ncbi:MAG: thymidine kinase [Candidatus Babeliales bacterium]
MSHNNTQKKGTLEVICGSMFSGKSEELIRRLKRAQLAKKNVLAFKHSLDDRTFIEYVVSHNGNKIKALPIEKAEMILELIPADIEVIGIDEIQFFEQNIINIICNFIEQGKRVIAAGLDLGFNRKPFGAMPLLLSIADHITKLKAICILCGKDAHFTQRLVNNRPAKFEDPTILVGAQEAYQARCRDCHIIDKQPEF